MPNTQPQIPVNQITIVSKTATSISIRWSKATDKETPQNQLQYRVTCAYDITRIRPGMKPLFRPKFLHKESAWTTDMNSYSITGLQPQTPYIINVKVKDADGAESNYASIRAITMPEATVTNTAPVISNKNVYINKINTTSIDVSWEKATDKETPQQNLQYRVLWCVPGNNWKSSAFANNITSYRISGLIPDTQYNICVQVYDGEIVSQYNTVYVTTAQSVSPGTGGTGGNTDAERRREINNGLARIGFNANTMLNNDLYNDRTVYPEAMESLPDRDFAFLLTKKENKMDNEEIYVRGSGYENIYPGAILVVDDQITGGSPNPLGRIARNKISIYGDFLAGSTTTQENVNPNNQDVRTASNRIMETLLSDSRYEAPGMQRPKTKIHTSKQSLMLDLAVDANFAGCNVNVKAKTDSSEQTFIHATTLEQDYFTVKLKDTWKQDPSSLFDNSVTWNQLSSVLNGRAIAVVTSVTYGRTFSYLREYNAKKFKYEGSQVVKYDGSSGSSNQNVSIESSYQDSSIFNLGGTALTIATLKAKEKNQQALENAMAENMKFSRNNQGVVTKYTIQLITGTNPGQVLHPLYSGSQYTIGYTKCPRRIPTKFNVKDVTIGGKGGGNVRLYLDVQCFRVVNGKPVIFRTIDESTPDKQRDPWYWTTQNTKEVEFGNLNPGEYIYKDPLLRVKARITQVSSYSQHTQRRLNHGEIETGSMEVILGGSVYSSVSIRDVKAR